MKNILLTLVLLVPLAALAADDAIMLELGFGFGHSGKVTKTAEELANPYNNMFCYHRPSSRMVYGAVRYRYDDVEAHIAHWFNDSDQARCERDSFAVGLGYVFDTQTGGRNGVEDLYATYTPGLAYTWGGNKDFNVQDNTNTNWRLKDNWQMYNRVAVGGGNVDANAEIAIVRYGLIASDYERKGENFMTLSIGARDFDEPKTATTSDRGLTPPTEPDTIIIVNEQPVTPNEQPPALPPEEQPPEDQPPSPSPS